MGNLGFQSVMYLDLLMFLTGLGGVAVGVDYPQTENVSRVLQPGGFRKLALERRF